MAFAPKLSQAFTISSISEVVPICSSVNSFPLALPISEITTLQPSSANRNAMASPIPP